jgi:hypothetical protein
MLPDQVYRGRQTNTHNLFSPRAEGCGGTMDGVPQGNAKTKEKVPGV